VIALLFATICWSAELSAADLKPVISAYQAAAGKPIAVVTQNGVVENQVRSQLVGVDQLLFAQAGSSSEASAAIKKVSATCGLFIMKSNTVNFDLTPVGDCPALAGPNNTASAHASNATLPASGRTAVCIPVGTKIGVAPAKTAEQFMTAQLAVGKTEFVALTLGSGSSSTTGG